MKVTNIKQQVKRADRFAIYIDNKYVLSLGESELLDSGLIIGTEISSTQLIDLKSRAVVDKAMDSCLRYLAIRPRSTWEIESYLKRKRVDETTSKKILNKLTKSGFLDDEAFAKSWVENRRLLKPVSKRRLMQELRQKRVPDSITDKILDEDEVEDISTLHQLIEKKRARYPEELKLMQYLARQGYNYSDIKQALETHEPAD